MINSYFKLLRDTIDKIDQDSVLRVSELIRSCEGNIFVFGNGGSAATASHFAQDMNKQLNYRFICLNDNIPSMLAYGNDDCFDSIFKHQLTKLLRPKDLVIGISCSGNSQNVVRAIIYANQYGCKTIGFTGFDCGEVGIIAKHGICVPSHDMQICEDIHLILTHVLLRILK
jgi:D-sedoheptulose 7-phosphate isomerase